MLGYSRLLFWLIAVVNLSAGLALWYDYELCRGPRDSLVLLTPLLLISSFTLTSIWAIWDTKLKTGRFHP